MDSVQFTEDFNFVRIIDQTCLPVEIRTVDISTLDESIEAIAKLRVRGAPAIGIFAAFALAVIMKKKDLKEPKIFEKELKEAIVALSETRPTAVNLSWALGQMDSAYQKAKRIFGFFESNIPRFVAALYQMAAYIKQDDISRCEKIGEYGLSVMKAGSSILTICNAGRFATSRLGTALAPIYLAQSNGLSPSVFACETRPLMQGSRLTAYELMEQGVSVTLICDNMAAHVMSKGNVDMVFIGCDRIAGNGDVANKIGSLSLAIIAANYGIPFYVLGPESTIDHFIPDGNSIIVEERPSEEVTDMWFSKKIAPSGVSVYNPSFDIVPARLITGGIITERGIYKYDKEHPARFLLNLDES